MGTSSVEEDEERPSDEEFVTELLESSPAYTTELGAAFNGDSRELLKELPDNSIDLIVTSPPFALQHEKEYGNESQEEYSEWFLQFVPEVRRVLQPHGSFIVEIGGAFEKGWPRRSIYQWKLLTRIVEEEDLEFAQDWYWYNPSKLPNPIEWVNVRKLRGVDAVTQIWWLAKQINKEPAYTDDLRDKVETLRSVREQFDDGLTNEEQLTIAKTVLYGDVVLSEVKKDHSAQQTLHTVKSPENGAEEPQSEPITFAELKDMLADTRYKSQNEWELENNLSQPDVEVILDQDDSADERYFGSEEKQVLLERLPPYWVLRIFDLMVRTNKAPRVFGNEVMSAIEEEEPISPPYPKPEVNNQRNLEVLTPYSESHKELIETGEYNEGERSSGHDIGDSFGNDNEGAIPKNFIKASNTVSQNHYQNMCREFGFDKHPARFPEAIPKKFINLLTPDPPYDDWERGDVGSPGYLDRPIVLDIFAGSNWTGKVAEDHGRHWISFEKDEEYVATSELRFLSKEEIKNRLENEDDPLHEFRTNEDSSA